MIEKTYLGDSVYAKLGVDGTIKLTTENGYGPSNEIYLDPEVMEALQEYYKRALEAAKAEQEAK